MPLHPRRVLVLGGTTEAGALAHALATAGIDAIYSYAGRTARPAAQPIAMRVGGFGGTQGLKDFLAAHRITHLVDATHPFAARISRNASAACEGSNVALMALERAVWMPRQGDLWTPARDIEAAVALLPTLAMNVFLAIGRQTLEPFATKPQHHYILRLVDPPDGALPLPDATVVLARGPFDPDSDAALLRAHGVDLIVAKNAGGAGADAKLIAARHLALPVIMIDRPALRARHTVATVAEVMDWLHQTPDDLADDVADDVANDLGV